MMIKRIIKIYRALASHQFKILNNNKVLVKIHHNLIKYQTNNIVPILVMKNRQTNKVILHVKAVILPKSPMIIGNKIKLPNIF